MSSIKFIFILIVTYISIIFKKDLTVLFKIFIIKYSLIEHVSKPQSKKKVRYYSATVFISPLNPLNMLKVKIDKSSSNELSSNELRKLFRVFSFVSWAK